MKPSASMDQNQEIQPDNAAGTAPLSSGVKKEQAGGSQPQNSAPSSEKIRELTHFKEIYEGIMKGDREKVLAEYAKLKSGDTSASSTVFKDTILHIAIYMRQEDIAREILKKCNEETLLKPNAIGNTVLHEASEANMMNLAKDLLISAPGLLGKVNKHGETALFRAAHFGCAEMFAVLADIVAQKERDQRTALEPHLKRRDGTTILQITIVAGFFGLALEIARRYKVLVEREIENSRPAGLQLLSCIPSAFKSSTNYGLIKRFIYHCVPDEDFQREKKSHRRDAYEFGDDYDFGMNTQEKKSEHPIPCYVPKIVVKFTSELRKINVSIWECLRRGWPMMKRIYEEKRKHESAFELAKFLIIEDHVSWEESSPSEGDKVSPVTPMNSRSQDDGNNQERSQTGSPGQGEKKEGTGSSPNEPAKSSDHPSTKDKTTKTAPLLLATATGIIEIVEEILDVYPQALEHICLETGRNILHEAIRHRQLDIFHLIKKMDIPMARLVRRIDNSGYTILHQVGEMGYHTGSTNHPGPAFQLQEELRWFERVRKITPPHYEMHRSSEKVGTAEEFFEESHKKLLEEAQEWLKRTSESCSTVAVLIATVAFAAAYTVPGGSDEKTGTPILLHDPFFLIFTVMDVLSLASSLTSVVMFLSILTSPLHLKSFRHSLPRKLTLGFTFLFFSVAVTMLAFAATLMLIVRLKKRWTTTLMYTAAFLPVSIFALLQFPLYVAFKSTWKFSLKLIKRILPWHCRFKTPKTSSIYRTRYY
ncbi:uncharacterized protein LOC121264269 [Juglans microcarpa x Juglans regia]|uniref:uncharacterized protein LOC121264269 n=1 Tax=Juglans microcarpa x Juglans regia TaxID=2249226 RepID=UPI001B7E034A|nr:uncharacterized protein LOC121264269 [Juglans microcarpa x Juglans regia]